MCLPCRVEDTSLHLFLYNFSGFLWAFFFLSLLFIKGKTLKYLSLLINSIYVFGLISGEVIKYDFPDIMLSSSTLFFVFSCERMQEYSDKMKFQHLIFTKLINMILICLSFVLIMPVLTSFFAEKYILTFIFPPHKLSFYLMSILHLLIGFLLIVAILSSFYEYFPRLFFSVGFSSFILINTYGIVWITNLSTYILYSILLYLVLLFILIDVEFHRGVGPHLVPDGEDKPTPEGTKKLEK
jgi:hypothetical protein